VSDRVHFKSHPQIVDEVLSYLPAQWRAGFTGKVLYRLILAFALSLEASYALLAKLLRLAIPATSEGVWLRAWVRGVNMETQGGIPASVVVRFRRFLDLDAPPPPAVDIPAGVEVSARNGIRYRTTAAAVLPAGEEFVDVPCLATTPGEQGNVAAGEVIGLVRNLGAIDEARNPNPAFGGRNAESDAEIKRRLPIHIEMLHRATIPATENAIRVDRERFPEVFAIRSERRIGTPGYAKFFVSDGQGSDAYRPSRWTAAPGLSSIWFTPVSWEEISGVNIDGWPCLRLGIVRRDEEGAERWDPSLSVTALLQGQNRWFHDSTLGRLYIRVSGDPNTMAITLYAGLFERIRVYLEENWIANGVGLDVVAPYVVRIPLSLRYSLEPGYQRAVVDNDLRLAVSDYIASRQLGEDFELEGIYAYLNRVAGAGGVLVVTPVGNVAVPADSVARLDDVPVITLA
jgi:uncharacterized phage protein gp47/JayE